MLGVSASVDRAADGRTPTTDHAAAPARRSRSPGQFALFWQLPPPDSDAPKSFRDRVESPHGSDQSLLPNGLRHPEDSQGWYAHSDTSVECAARPDSGARLPNAGLRP